jgi:hypothetical protein
MITFFKLFESDLIYIKGENGKNGKSVVYYDKKEGPIPFLYYKGTVYTGEIGGSHDGIIGYYFSSGDMTEDSKQGSKYMKAYMGHTSQGRIYTKRKYVSFWRVPDKKEMRYVLGEVERLTGEKILHNGYKIQFRDAGDVKAQEVYAKLDIPEYRETKTMLLDDYLYEPVKKTTPLAYRQAIYGENKSYKIFKNKKYKPQLTSSELVDFICDNNLRDANGELEYQDAKEIAYWSESGIWYLKELIDLNKEGLSFIYNRKPKSFGIPIIVKHDVGNDTYEVLDGKHRIGYTRYKGIPTIMAYVCENEY